MFVEGESADAGVLVDGPAHRDVVEVNDPEIGPL
jgi:hypothetical protein